MRGKEKVKIMSFLRKFRNVFFKEVSKNRLLRILFCSFVIAILWCFTDWLGGIYEPKLRDDLICLVLGIISERLIPWGKSNPKSEYSLQQLKSTN